MNNCHRYLDLPVEFVPEFVEISKAPQTHFDIDKNNSHIREWIESLGYRIFLCEAFYISPQQQQIKPHLDGPKFDNHVKLIFAHFTSNHAMGWYVPHDVNKVKKFTTIIGTTAFSAKREDCKQVYSAVLSAPSLVNVGMLHDLQTDGKSPFYCWTIVLSNPETKKLVAWDDAIVKFQSFIAE